MHDQNGPGIHAVYEVLDLITHVTDACNVSEPDRRCSGLSLALAEQLSFTNGFARRSCTISLDFNTPF
jgi:hypothetical protein